MDEKRKLFVILLILKYFGLDYLNGSAICNKLESSEDVHYFEQIWRLLI